MGGLDAGVKGPGKIHPVRSGPEFTRPLSEHLGLGSRFLEDGGGDATHSNDGCLGSHFEFLEEPLGEVAGGFKAGISIHGKAVVHENNGRTGNLHGLGGNLLVGVTRWNDTGFRRQEVEQAKGADQAENTL